MKKISILLLILLVSTCCFAFKFGVKGQMVNVDNTTFSKAFLIKEITNGSLASQFLRTGDAIIAAGLPQSSMYSSEYGMVVALPMQNQHSSNGRTIDSTYINNTNDIRNIALKNLDQLKNIISSMETSETIIVILRGNQIIEFTIR